MTDDRHRHVFNANLYNVLIVWINYGYLSVTTNNYISNTDINVMVIISLEDEGERIGVG